MGCLALSQVYACFDCRGPVSDVVITWNVYDITVDGFTMIEPRTLEKFADWIETVGLKPVYKLDTEIRDDRERKVIILGGIPN